MSVDKLFGEAPLACFGRICDISKSECESCPESMACYNLTRARTDAGHEPLSDWLPEGYEFKGKAVTVPKKKSKSEGAPPAVALVPITERPPPQPGEGQSAPSGIAPVPAAASAPVAAAPPPAAVVVEEERPAVPLTEERLEQLKAQLKLAAEEFQAAASRVYVDLVYTAGPLLDEAHRGMDPAQFWAWAEGVVGYKRTMARGILELWRTFPEEQYRERLEKIGKAETLHQLVTTGDPRAFLEQSHYVPRTGTMQRVEDMETTRDLRDAKAHAKAVDAGTAAHDETTEAPAAKKPRQAKRPPEVKDALMVLQSGATMVRLWASFRANLPKLPAASASEVEQLSTMQAQLQDIIDDIDGLTRRQ